MVKMPPRVALEALVAFLFVGCVFMVLDHHSETAAAPTLKSIKLTNADVPDFLPTSQCPAGGVPAQDQKNVNLKFSCSWLNGVTGCCANQVPLSKYVRPESVCSDKCWSLYLTYWCIAACDASTVTICDTSLQSLFTECNTQGCGLFSNEVTGNAGQQQFLDLIPGRVKSASTACQDLAARAPVTTQPTFSKLTFDYFGDAAASYSFPTLREMYVDARKKAVVTNNAVNIAARDAAKVKWEDALKAAQVMNKDLKQLPRYVTVNIEVVSVTQVLFGKFSVVTPEGGEAVTIAIPDWELKAGTTNIYVPSMAVKANDLVSPGAAANPKAILRPANTIQPTFLAPSGVWKITSVYAVNHAGSFMTSPPDATFTVTTMFPQTFYPTVSIGNTVTDACRSNCYANAPAPRTAGKCSLATCYSGCPDACEDCLNDVNDDSADANVKANMDCVDNNCFTNFNAWTPTLNSAQVVEFGCAQSSKSFPIVLQQGTKTAVFSAAKINFNAVQNKIYGLSVTANDVTFTLANGALTQSYDQTLELLDGAQLLVKGTFQPQPCLGKDLAACNTLTTTVTGDSAKSALKIAAGGTFACTQKVVVTVPLEINGTLAMASTCSLSTSGGILFGPTSAVALPRGGKDFTFDGDATLAGGSFTCPAPPCPSLRARSGTVTINSNTELAVNLACGTPTGASKALVQAGNPKFSVCSGSAGGGNLVTVGQDGTFEVRPCSHPGCVCFGATPRVAHSIKNAAGNNGLILQAGSYLRFNEVGNDAAFGILFIDDTAWDFRTGSNIVIQLTSQLDGNAKSVEIMYYRPANGQTSCSVRSTINIQPSLSPRTVTTRCITKQASPLAVLGKGHSQATENYNVLVVDIGPAVPSSGTTDRNQFQFNSTDLFSLTLNKNCGQYGPNDFTNDVLSVQLTGRQATLKDQVYVSSSKCGSVVLQFRCQSSTSPQDATNLCYTIISDAVTPGTPLYAKVQGIQGGVAPGTSSSNNNALYALFALLAIPVVIIIVICLAVKAKQREADNQYMQDTATFSNVAASPQPMGAHPGLYPSELQPVVASDQYLHKPY